MAFKVDPRKPPAGQPGKPAASFQNALEAPQLLRGPQPRRVMAQLALEPWYSRGARIAQVLAIPAVMFYCVFIHDYGPHEHVFSAPQRWFKEKTASWRAVSSTPGSLSEEKKS